MWFWHTQGKNYRLSNLNSKCAFRIQITHFAVMWKQSLAPSPLSPTACITSQNYNTCVHRMFRNTELLLYLRNQDYMQITGKENEDDKPELWTSRAVQHGYQESYQSDWVGLWNTPWSGPGMPYPITNETKQNMQKQHDINHLFTTSLLHEHPALQYACMNAWMNWMNEWMNWYACLIQSFIPGFWLSLTEELTGNVKSLENYYILKWKVLFVK